MQIIQFQTPALGDNSYLVVAGHQAAAVDPQRDVRPYLEAAERHGVTITHVFETHIHNDYISGGPELAARGATIVAPAAADLGFEYTAVEDGDEVTVGDARLRAVAAPGHTYEHHAYLALDEQNEIRGVFSGGAILIAGAGRSDLLGPDHSETLARLQWDTGRRLREMLPNTAEVLPTHGAGSFCSSGSSTDDRRAPLAVELGRNPLFTSGGYDEFRALHLDARPTPNYYRHMAPINREGAAVHGEPPRPRLLEPDELVTLAADGVTVVDVRSRHDYTRGHIPAAVDIEESGSMLAYASWMLPFNSPMALVTYEAEQADRVTTDFFRIGFEDIRGYLPHESWVQAGRELATLEAVDLDEARRIAREGTMPVLDVRFAHEHAETPLPGALQLPVDELPQWTDQAPSGDALVICASGQRAVMAASFLERTGRRVLALSEGGAEELREGKTAGLSGS